MNPQQHRDTHSISESSNTTSRSQQTNDGLHNCAKSISKSLTMVVMASPDYAKTLQQMESLGVQDAQELEAVLAERIHACLIASAQNKNQNAQPSSSTVEQSIPSQSQSNVLTRLSPPDISNEGNTVQDPTFAADMFDDLFEGLSHGDTFL